MQVSGKRIRENDFFNKPKRQRLDQADSMQTPVPGMVDRIRAGQQRAAIPVPRPGPWGLFIPWVAEHSVAPNLVVRDPVPRQMSAADDEETLSGYKQAEWPVHDNGACSSASGFLGYEAYSAFPFDGQDRGSLVDENGQPGYEVFPGYPSSPERSPPPSPEWKDSAGSGEADEASSDEPDRDLLVDENSQSTNEESDSMFDERPSSERSPPVLSPSVGYSETTEESSTDPDDDLGPDVRAEIQEDVLEASKKSQEALDAGAAEREKREPISFEGNGFIASVQMWPSKHAYSNLDSKASISLYCEGELANDYLQPLVKSVQEKLMLSSKLHICACEGGGATVSEVLRRIPQSQLAGISWLQFDIGKYGQVPADILQSDFLQPESLDKLLPTIRTLKVTSPILETLLERCSESMAQARVSTLSLSLQYISGPSIAEWLAQHTHLKNLVINHWDFYPEMAVDDAIDPMLLALERNTSLQGLSLMLDATEHSEALISLIEKNTRIRRLKLKYCLRGPEGEAIIQAFHLRPRLDKLEISLQGLDVWTAFTSLIASPSCPREVKVTDLDQNPEFDERWIISALAENRNLEMLDLTFYHFDREAAPSFVDMVESHPTLKGIRCGTRIFSRDDKERIERALNRNRNREKIQIDASVALQRLAGDCPPEISAMIVDEFLLLPQQYMHSSLQTLDNLARIAGDDGAGEDSQESTASA